MPHKTCTSISLTSCKIFSLTYICFDFWILKNFPDMRLPKIPYHRTPLTTTTCPASYQDPYKTVMKCGEFLRHEQSKDFLIPRYGENMSRCSRKTVILFLLSWHFQFLGKLNFITSLQVMKIRHKNFIENPLSKNHIVKVLNF